MTIETLKEGWVEFQRLHCEEGFIDYWIGDASSVPTDDVEKPFKLHRTVTYYRLNGSGWMNGTNFPSNFLITIYELRHLFPASEIWMEGLFGK